MKNHIPALTAHDFEPPRSTIITGSQPAQQGSTFLAILVILARRKKFIFWTTMAFAAVTCAVAFIVPAEYTATIVILPPQQSSSLSSALGDLGGLSSLASLASGALGSKNTEEMYVSMMKSESVEDAVIQKCGLMQEYHNKYYYDARKTLEWRTTIDGSKKDGLIRLSFEDHDPARAAQIANGYIEILRTLSQHLAITEAAQRRVVFEQQLDKTKEDLANAEEALKQTQLSTGFVQIDSQARALITSAATLRAQMVAKEVQIQAMQAYAGEGNPDLQEQERELEGLRTQFNQLVGSNGSSSDDLFLSKGNVPEAALEYARKLRDVKYNEAIFEFLAKQLEVAKIDEAKEGGFLQIVNPALVPERRSFPKRILITLGAAAFGLSFAVMLALLEVRVARMRANPVEAAQLAQLRQAVWQHAEAATAHDRSSAHGPSADESVRSSEDDFNLHDAINR
ncbi:MAG: GumC family protein [Terracidiphilus sp.]